MISFQSIQHLTMDGKTVMSPYIRSKILTFLTLSTKVQRLFHPSLSISLGRFIIALFVTEALELYANESNAESIEKSGVAEKSGVTGRVAYS